jgi:sugar fermentation stimulation protein A
MIPNRIAAEAFEAGLIPAFRRYGEYRGEVKIAADTRIDFVLGKRANCYVEVKNVTLVENGVARFPDSVTTRGHKHVRHLIQHVQGGGKAFVLFVVQHHAARLVTPADDLDPEFGRVLRRAAAVGVRIEAWQASVSPTEITLSRKLPVQL